MDDLEVGVKIASYLGPSYAGLLGQGVLVALKKLDPTPAFIAKRDKISIEWWAEVVQQVQEHERRLNALEREVLHRRLTEDHEAIGILANYVQQAHSEPLDERRRMLAFAAAGLANVHLGIGELARVQRILRELDPDDVVALYKVWLIRSGSPSKAHLERYEVQGEPGADRVRLAYWQESGAESLISSGCLRIVAAGGGMGTGTHEELRVTRTGITVLRTLRPYITARSPDVSDVPGHEVTEGFRSEDEARAMILAVPGVYDVLLGIREPRFVSCFYDPCNIADGSPANGAAKLNMNVIREVAETLKQSLPQRQVEMQQPVDDIFLRHVGEPGHDGRVHVQVGGPHDVMRFLAYDLDARWS